jgi:hypothetical protein
MVFFVALLVNGMLARSLYALIALAFVVVYKTSRMINFALGDLEAVWKQSLCKTTSYAASVVRPKTELLGHRSHIETVVKPPGLSSPCMME